MGGMQRILKYIPLRQRNGWKRVQNTKGQTMLVFVDW